MESYDAETIEKFNTLTQYLKDKKWTEFLELYNSMGRDTQRVYSQTPTNRYCPDDKHVPQTEKPETKDDEQPVVSHG